MTLAHESTTLDQFIRATFECAGITFREFSFFRWRVVDDRLFQRPITNVRELLEELNDGRYHISLEEVKISGLGDQEPTEIDHLDIELIYEEGNWTYQNVIPGEETFEGVTGDDPELSAKGLRERFEKIGERLRPAFNLLRVFADIAEHL